MTADDSLNVSYYEALAADYELFFQDPERDMEQEGNWLVKVLERYRARDVLDACCGTGRQAIPLSKHGYCVTGADASRAMLGRAALRAASHEVSLPLVCARFAELGQHFGRRFDAVVALGNGLCNLESPNAILTALRGMRACCRENGICVIGIKDFARLRREDRRFHQHRVIDRGGVRSILFEVWDFCDPVLVSTAYLVRGRLGESNWTTVSAHTREYMLTPEELDALAKRANFRAVHRLNHPSESAFLLEC